MVNTRGPRTFSDLDEPIQLSAPRAAVLELLQQRSEPARVGDLATPLGQHDNTVRAHLDALVSSGLVNRHRAVPNGRGRPAWLYQADPMRSEPNARVREHAALAGALATHIATTSSDPIGEALQAGEAWGRSTARARYPDGPLSHPKDARQATVTILAGLGFDPVANDPVASVALHRCPMLGVARAQPDVVCQVHLGLVKGAMDELGGDATGTDLVPFAEPGACRLYLMAQSEEDPQS
jgi:predicted ArsR family transcriptional regulator